MNSYNYTTGNTFTLNNIDYVGYYNITTDTFFTGIEKTNSSLQLDKQSTILGEFISSKNYFNYIPLKDPVLSFNIKNIQFGSNEIINCNSINNKFTTIIDNYLQIYRNCLAATSYLPTGYTAFASITGIGESKMYWRDYTYTGAYILSTINNALTGITNIQLIRNNFNTDINVITQTSKSYFVFRYKENLTTFSLIASAIKTDDNSNIYFSNITSIDTDDNGNLYVADNINKQVYKIGLQSLVNNSRVSLNNPKLLTTIGELSNPAIVRYGKGKLFIYDSQTFTVLQYNSKLTPVATYTNKKIFQDNQPCSLEVDQNGNLLILTSTGLFLSINDTLAVTSETTNLNINLGVNEYYKSIKLSLNNSNILYISTNKNVYKIYTDKKDLTIGNFKWENTTIGSVDNLSFANIYTPYNYDNILIYDNNRFMLFNEINAPVSTLKKDYFKIYTSTDILLKSNYFNNITFNTSIFKILYNHNLLISFLQSKFKYKYINEEPLLDGLSVFTPSSLSGLQVSEDIGYFAGINENLTPQVFNRIINKILYFQNSILGTMYPIIVNTKYSNNQVISF